MVENASSGSEKAKRKREKYVILISVQYQLDNY